MDNKGPASDLAEIEAAILRIQSYTIGMSEADFAAGLVVYDANGDEPHRHWRGGAPD